MPANETQIGGDHYRKHKIQPWDAYEEWLGHDGFVGNLRGNILSYLIRYKDKGGVADLKKARHDLDKLIEVESEPTQGPEVQNTPCRTFPDHPTLRCACYNYSTSGREICPKHPYIGAAERDIGSWVRQNDIATAKKCICGGPPLVSDPARECPAHPYSPIIKESK